MELKGYRVLITGASGFIGSRLCERLYLEHKASITAVIRNMGRASRIGRMKLNLVRCDVLDKNRLNNLLNNIDVVVHLAAGDVKTIVQGTKNIASLCRIKGIKLIHMSSAAVYGIQPMQKHINEDAPLKRTGNPYSDAKIKAEKIINKEIRAGLKSVILRPRIIYGPYSIYVVNIFKWLNHNRFVLVDDGHGACNSVFIDNLIDVIFLSITSDRAINQTFFVTDDENLTWGGFYREFLCMINQNIKFINISSSKTEALKRPSLWKELKSFTTSNSMKSFLLEAPLLRSLFKPVHSSLSLLPEHKKIAIKDYLGIYRPERHIKPVNDDYLNFDKSRLLRESGDGFTSIEKAKNLLGYEPRVKFKDGAGLTMEWLAHIGLP